MHHQTYQEIIEESDAKLIRLDMMRRLTMVNWVQNLAPWDVVAHLTWKDKIFIGRGGEKIARGVKIDSARFFFERFMRKQFPRLSYFYAVEENPCRSGHHIHAMFCGEGLRRTQFWSQWFAKFGRAVVEPIRGTHDVAEYCAKYVTKETGTWWNTQLQWHHKQALTALPFTLESTYAE